MAGHGRSEEPPDPRGRFADDLIGLDPNDPETQAFAAHLDRMEGTQSRSTIEGMLQGVSDFAHSANRAGGHRRLWVVLVVTLMLFGVAFTAWNAIIFVFATFAG